MADNPAGEVQLELGLDTKGIEKSFNSLMDKVKHVFDKKAPKDFNEEVDKAEEKTNSLKDSLNGLADKVKNAFDKKAPTAFKEEVSDSDKKSKSLKNSLSGLAEKIKSAFNKKAPKEQGEETDKTNKKTKSLKDTISSLAKKIKSTYDGWRKKQKENREETKKTEDSMKRLKTAVLGAFSVATVLAFGKACMESTRIQQEAERKLETIMINRMNASKNAIQSVKDLASELQGIGVVGDEASIAGASTLASYVSSADSIKSLLPDMADLAVANFGSKINGDQMSDIAEQIGEAIATGAITTLESRRITLSDAELAVWNSLKTEAERVEFISQKIKANFNGINTNALNDWDGKLQQTLNKLGDLKEKLGAIIQNVLMPVLNFASSIIDMLDAGAQKLMDIMGIKMSKSMSGAASASNVISKGLETANAEAEKLQRTLFGFDKINRLNAPSSDASTSAVTTTGSGNTGTGGTTFKVEAETSRLLTSLDKIKGPLKEWYSATLKPFVDSIGEVLVNAIDWCLTKLEKFSKWVEENPEKFNNLCNAILLVVSAISGFLIVSKIVAFFAALNPVIGGLIILVGALVSAFIIGEGNIVEGFKVMLKTIWEAFVSVVNKIGEIVGNLFLDIFGWIGKQIGKFINWIGRKKEDAKESGLDTETFEASYGGSLPFATGGFVRANTPILATVGDNPRQGEFILTESQFANAIDKYGSGVGNSQVISLLTQLISVVQGMHLESRVDGNGITNMVVSNINSKTRATGNCPIRT